MNFVEILQFGMMNFLPALTKGDAGAFNAAVKKSIWLAVILMLIIFQLAFYDPAIGRER